MTENAITHNSQVILAGEDKLFKRLYGIISTNRMLRPSMKFGLERELRQIENILDDGKEIDYHRRCLLVCHLRNMRRLSPFTAEILSSALAALPVMRELVTSEYTLYLPSRGELFLL